MRRRDLVAGFVYSTALRSASTPGIVDAHVHFYDPARPQGVPWPPKGDPLYRTILPAPWSDMVRPLGVTGVIVVEASPWLEDNQWVLDLARDYAIIRGFVGHLLPGAADFRQQLARFQRSPLFRGIRLGEAEVRLGLSDTKRFSDLQHLSDGALSLDVLGGASMLPDVIQLARRIPNLRVVIDHLPFDGDAPHLSALQDLPNVYAKLSGSSQLAQDRDHIYRSFGEDRVMYASNWPVCERVASYQAVLASLQKYFAAKSANARDKFFHSNCERAYRLASVR